MNTLHRCLMLSIFCLFLFAPVKTMGTTGDLAIGQWRHHLPNNRIISLAETPDRVVGATPYGLVVYNKKDSSMERVSKVDGLTGFGISAIAWSAPHNALVIGYEDGNLDMMIHDNVFNIPDILQASILGSKRINHIMTKGDKALIACDFGIVELDLEGMLISDTWHIGPYGSMVHVYDLEKTDTMLYAATNAGLLHARLDAPNLADFRHWHKTILPDDAGEVIRLVASHGTKLIAVSSTPETDRLYLFDGGQWQYVQLPDEGDNITVNALRSDNGFLLVIKGDRIVILDAHMQHTGEVRHYYYGSAAPNDALYDDNNTLWVADNRRGLVRQNGPHDYEQIILAGPDNANAFGLAHAGGRLWVAPGFVTYGGSNSWNQNGYSFFDQGQWTRYTRWQFPLLDRIADIIHITVDPGNLDKAYASAWWGGIAVITTEGVIERYDENNSTLQLRAGVGDRLRVGGTAMDRDGNLWVTNSEVDRPLSVRKANGEWMSFTSGGTFGPQTNVRDIIIDNSGQKWVNLQGNGIFVFKEHSLNNNAGYDVRRLTTQPGNGGLPTNRVHSLAVDHNGYVWIGTEEGVAVFYSPGRALSGDPFDAQRIVVEQDDGFAGYLLETETVTCITVDGSNKKWFGTERSGAFLLSADGRETVFHFHKGNSPLPSNNIFDIAINHQNGEVFFATDSGIASYRGFATEATTRHDANLYAYPNPVRPGYDGYIAVKGLVRNAKVKITDISGNLVWETIAEGGQAIWNGQDLFGRRPGTGVYLVFSTNDDGEETMVTKILFIN